MLFNSPKKHKNGRINTGCIIPKNSELRKFIKKYCEDC